MLLLNGRKRRGGEIGDNICGFTHNYELLYGRIYIGAGAQSTGEDGEGAEADIGPAAAAIGPRVHQNFEFEPLNGVNLFIEICTDQMMLSEEELWVVKITFSESQIVIKINNVGTVLVTLRHRFPKDAIENEHNPIGNSSHNNSLASKKEKKQNC
ncbi:unnamed protein product [Fraxinus pennsylvanica]|uniref:Uncharacterized protein n=1 Tax=Fraxinus pennsylvanica TaxID=56036 RepID=A0AAD2DPF4_9LAMI|nr:unnamed protein product [Fraxinus pennsylvanica]